MAPKPLLKYLGGKTSIMNDLIDKFPKEFNNYHEPFVGSASVLIEMFNRKLLNNDKNIFISDLMQPLINMYSVVVNSPNELITELTSPENQYENNLESFTRIKECFNKNDSSNIERAAQFIYLNKTGFNGMYRENQKGIYNIPFGKQANPKICDVDRILELHELLTNNSININHTDYSSTLDNVVSGDFVYLDPPYYNNFTGYIKEPFKKQQQIELKEFINQLVLKGCHVAMSNSNDPFILELYSNVDEYTIHYINVKRAVNSKGSDRGIIKQEVLICTHSKE